MNEDIQIRVQKGPWMQDQMELLIHAKFPKGENDVGYQMGRIHMEETPAFTVTEPTLRLTETQAQVLMDDLWNCGIRPAEGKGSAGSLKATENHLADMRQIVFQALRVQYNGGKGS